MPHPRRLIPPPSGGSFGCFTSPTRGRAKSAFRLDSESQEDRGGPQPTSSEGGRGDVFAAAALWFAYIGRRLQTGGRLTPPALMSAPQAVHRRGRRYTPAGNQLRGTAVITARATQSLSRFDLDFRMQNSITRLLVNGAPASFIYEKEQELVITPASSLVQGRTFTVTVDYAGQPLVVTDPDTSIEGWVPTDDALARERSDGAVPRDDDARQVRRDLTFFQLLRDWATQNRFGTVTTPQFIALAEQESGMDLTQFFNVWIYEDAKPVPGSW